MYVQPPLSTTPPLSTHRGWTSSTAACCHLLSYALPGITPPWPVLQTWSIMELLWNWNCHVASAIFLGEVPIFVVVNSPFVSLVPKPEWASGTVTASRLGLYGTRWWLTSSVCWSTHEYYRYVYIPYIYTIYICNYINYISTMSCLWMPLVGWFEGNLQETNENTRPMDTGCGWQSDIIC